MAEWPSFTDGSYVLESAWVSNADAINYYGEAIEKGPRAGKMRLRQCPGLPTLCTLPTGPFRGIYAPGDRLFAVGGGILYELYLNPNPTPGNILLVGPSLGNVGNGTNPVEIVSNGFQLALSSAGKGYITGGPLVPNPPYPSDQSVIPIIDTQGQPLNSSTMAFMDQYFIAGIAGTSQLQVSNLAPAGGIWDPGDVATKEAFSDVIQRVWVDQPGGELLVLFGQQTMEVWQDTGGLFPFSRIQGCAYPIGCDSAWAVAGLNGQRLWLYQGTVYLQAGSGYPNRASDYGVEQAIKGYSYYDQTNCEGSCYLQGGHMFYALSFPQAGVTWVWDAATGNWHKRLIWQNNAWGRYRPRLFAQQFGMILGGDYATGAIYSLDPTVFTDAGGIPLRRDRIAPYITDQEKNMRYNRLTLDITAGVGLSLPVGAVGQNPQIGMRYSADRGNTWSTWRNEALGAQGKYNKRVYWTQMGSSYVGMAIHTSITDPVDASINGAYIYLGQGTKAKQP